MRRILRNLCAAALTLAAPLPIAAQTLAVEGLVSPAWLERGGIRQPLAAGEVLSAADTVLTGRGGRVLLRMADGSAVRLGESASLGVGALDEKTAAGGSFVAAALDIARGAFRFTTGVFAAPRGGRDVRIRVSAVTAGIRGTDVWGKSEPERDIVCLIEGAVEVEHRGRAFRMQEPLSFFIAPRSGEPAPVAPVSRQQLDLWAEETEIRDGSGRLQRDGSHGVDATVARGGSAARQVRDRLHADGFDAVLQIERDGYGAEVYRVRIRGAASADDARALAARLRGLGYADAVAW